MSSQPRIGYAPFSRSFQHPADSRRFAGYARARGLSIEVARPDEQYDLVVVSELADITTWAEYRRGKVVFDFIDSYLAIPRTDLRQLLRGIVWYLNGRHSRLRLDFKGALEAMCARADAVVCTTEEQKIDTGAFCGNVHIVLDIHDEVVRSRKQDYSASTPFKLVWEGLPSNIPQLAAIAPMLREVAKRRPIELNIVTDLDRPGALPWLPRIKTAAVALRFFDNVVVHRWGRDTLSQVITKCDAAIIPIVASDPLTRGKPGNKLALLWRMGIPVVTTATPAYRRMQEAAGLGYLACDGGGDWTKALNRLMNDETSRRDAAERGFAYVGHNLTTDKLLSRWDAVFSSIGFNFLTTAEVP